ncbi:MAG: hypothetical protein OXD01_16020 [Gammaproteobacteria bacterium]|nr:hypothetical protein [Gammaproteobacteria bacterium]
MRPPSQQRTTRRIRRWQKGFGRTVAQGCHQGKEQANTVIVVDTNFPAPALRSGGCNLGKKSRRLFTNSERVLFWALLCLKQSGRFSARAFGRQGSLAI